MSRSKLSHVILLIGRNALEVIVREYVTKDGKRPFSMWVAMLDGEVRDRIRARLVRFTTGNLGDHKSLLDGLWEARFAFGPGYRIYFGKDGKAPDCPSVRRQQGDTAPGHPESAAVVARLSR